MCTADNPLCHRIFNEGTVEPQEQPAAAATQIPADSNGVVAYLSRLVSGATDSNVVATDVSTSLGIEDESITCNGNDSELKVLKYLKGDILGTVSGFYPAYDGSFGDSINAYPRLTVTGDTAVSAVCIDGSEDANGEITADGNYYFDIAFDGCASPVDESSPLYTSFNLKECAGIVEKIKAQTADMLTVKSSDITYDSFAINAKAEKATDKLDYVTFTRSCTVKLNVEFIGEYQKLGISEIGFVLTVSETYDYTWAGIEFTSDRIMLYKGEDNMLGIAAVIADDADRDDYELTFSSSDPDIVSVDNEGNIEGIEISPEPVTVTVTFKYCGHTYTDTCLAYVTKPVEGVEVTPDAVTLKIGGTAKLGYQLRPDDATITSVKWFTEDAEVAQVDGSGSITATGAGKTKVYAVTDDGYYRSSCHVTVEN